MSVLAAPRRYGYAYYVGLNALFLFALAVGYGIGDPQNPRILYLVLLFALCSTSVIDLDGLNGRYILLAIFLGLYFVYFGVQDLTNLFTGKSVGTYDGALSLTEEVILVGQVLLIIGYRIAVSIGNAAGKVRSSFDWSLPSVMTVGISLWVVGISATYYWYFFVVTDKTMEGTKGIASLGQWASSGLVLAEMLQPMGILLIAYAWRSTRSTLLLVILLAILAVQVLFGFVIDVKGMALTAASLVIVTTMLTDGRVPKTWIVGGLVFIYLAFPVFQAYRAVVTGNGVARTEVLANLGKTLDKVFEAKERVNSGRDRAQTFLERLSLKASVQMIVDGTANGIPYQHGYTLTPILSTFLPRILWSDKPDIPTGRIVNKVFNVTDQDETYISPSHLGEMYWNFGWLGVLVGMTTVGGLCGLVARANLAECRTVTRLLIFVTTVEMLIHGFEGAVAVSYVVWLRSIAAVGLLHLVFARVPVTGGGAPALVRSPDEVKTRSFQGVRLYPNLLR
jgi:hypothetical protein